MVTRIYYDADVPETAFKAMRIGIVGYGAQGQAHALNLRDAGCQVTIGQRSGGAGWATATADGFQPQAVKTLAKQVDLIALMLPDEIHGAVFHKEILPNARPNLIVMCCHGFSFHYGLVPQSPDYRRLLVAPKGQGRMVRGEYLLGSGVPCLVACDSEQHADLWPIGLAYAQAIGGTRAGVIETTIAAETETDLFGEQAVLCGGLTSLIQAGFETLVEAGYQPELAYFECLHELKIIADLLHERGIAAMRAEISTTAEYGDLTRGPRIIDPIVRQRMRDILQEIQSGEFAREFLEAQAEGSGAATTARSATADSLIESVGRNLRGMMPWLKRKK